jgi:hypothetical protein
MRMSGSGSEIDGADAEVEKLAAVLDVILTELVAYRLSRPAPAGPIRLIGALDTGRGQRDALFSRILDDPFEGALLFALRGVGEELFRLGGTSLMRAVLIAVARLDAENESRRLSPADAQWDGVGDNDDRWAA